jgi:DNA-directed RNA polymerase subunit alpha
MRIRWREFELPNRVVKDEAVSNDHYGMFVAEPFERGFGTTVGNGLRRVLLSSLEGAAVTHVKIEGVQHEFSTIDGVVEDVTEVLLNLKKLLVKLQTAEPRRLRLVAEHKGPVTAALFSETSDCAVLNKDLYICTLAKDLKLEVEVTVRRGRGYRTAEENADEEMELGIVPVDSVFSPVQRVRHATQATRVGKMTNYDKLVIEVWTNGTVTPDMALLEASKIYRKHLNPFVLPGEGGGAAPASLFAGIGMAAEEPEEESAPSDTDLKEVLSRPISALGLSVRAANCMKEENIETVGDLCRRGKDDLLTVKNFGKTSLREIEKKLDELGLEIGMDVDAVMNA